MRADQYDKLKARHVELVDVAIIETDPKTWPVGDAQSSKSERGDRYWSKKNAAATLTLLTKIESIINTVEQRQRDRPPQNPEDDDEDDDLDREIRAAESEAAAIIERARAKRR